MTSTLTGPPASRPARLAIVILSLLILAALTAPASQAAPVTEDAVLLQTVPSPWNDEFNEEAMEAVFGEDWEAQEFVGVQADAGPGGLFAPNVRFIWIEASDYSTELADEFIEIHQAALQSFVARGGRLFINSATNQEIDIEYDGRTIGMSNPNDESGEAVAVLPEHPIFKGPATPIATTFKGDSFAHGRVTGPGLTPLLVGVENLGPTNDAVVLAEYVSGSGRVALGAMTAVQHHNSEAPSKSLLINLLTYLMSPLPPAPPAPAPAPPAPPAPLVDIKKPKVKLTGVPKGCVEDGFRFRVKVSDESGVGAVAVKLDGKPLRKAGGNGKPIRTFKIRVPDAKLGKPGRHRIKVIARDGAGNVKRQGAGFKVCG